MAPSSRTSPSQSPDLSIPKHFSKLKDTRRRHRRLHLLQNILVIALCAVVAGAQDWPDVEIFGRRVRANESNHFRRPALAFVGQAIYRIQYFLVEGFKDGG